MNKKTVGLSLILASIILMSVSIYQTVKTASENDKKEGQSQVLIEPKKEIKVEEIKEEKLEKPIKKQKNLKQEIKVLAKYIKTRNSKIPIEIANLEAEFIVNIADKEGMNISLINGIIEKESLYDPTAVSSKSAKGLTQVLRCDGVEIDQNKIHDIAYNIGKGIEILQEKLKKSDGNLTSGLNKYSGGAGNYASSIYENIGRYTMFKEKEDQNIIAMIGD